jgi:paraquat-inducible protein B
MSAKANYFRLGMFIIVGAFLGIAGVIVFSSLQLFPEEVVYIETYFEESVQGLVAGSRLKMRGVTIGTVEEVGFVSSYYRDLPDDVYLEYGGLIRVKASLDPQSFEGDIRDKAVEALPARVERGLRIRLASQGLTGGKFLQADYLDPERFPIFEPKWEPDFVYIPSAEGVLEAIVSAVDRIVEKLEQLPIGRVVENMDQLVLTVKKGVEDAEIAKISGKAQRLLDDVHGIVNGPDVTQSLANFRETSEDLKETVAGLRSALESEQIRTAVDNVAAAAEKLPDMVTRMNRSLEHLDHFMMAESAEMQATMTELRLLIKNLRELTDVAKRYPAAVLFGKEPPESKPEEKP